MQALDPRHTACLPVGEGRVMSVLDPAEHSRELAAGFSP